MLVSEFSLMQTLLSQVDVHQPQPALLTLGVKEEIFCFVVGRDTVPLSLSLPVKGEGSWG